MPVEVHTINDGVGLHFIYSGELRHRENRRVNGILTNNPQFENSRFSIIDNLAVTKHLITSAEIRTSADFCLQRSQVVPKYIVAVIAGSNLSYGLGRMWQMLSESMPWSVRVFHDDEADQVHTWISQEYQRLFDQSLDNFDITGVLVPKLECLPDGHE